MLRAARRMTAALAGERVLSSDLRWPSLAGAELAGLTVLETVSYGKHLLTRFDDGRTLHSHLRMDGSWRLTPTRARAGGAPDTVPPATSQREPRYGGRYGRDDVRARLVTASWTCTGYHLGMMTLLRTRDERLVIGHLGPDLMADELTPEHEAEIGRRVAARADHTIGAVLLDQQVAAGIGTIYLAETLFRHRISPWRAARDVDDPVALMRTARNLMRTSADRPAGGRGGSVQIVVHSREGMACVRCAEPIRVGRVGTPPQDRPAFYCPRCQPR